MTSLDTHMPPQSVTLAAGAQAIINGALVTVKTDCEIEVGSGAVVVTGRALWRQRDAARNPSDELYFALLEVCGKPDRIEQERYRLFRLLSQVVAHERTHEAQRECSLCASALLAGDVEEATLSARRLASVRLEPQCSTPINPRTRRATEWMADPVGAPIPELLSQTT